MADTDIVVTGPDGSTFNFPAGTSSDTITAAMDTHYGQQAASTKPSGGLLSDITQFFSGGNEGLANTLGEPVDLMNAAIGLGARGINAVAGTNIQPSAKPFLGSAYLKDIMAPTIASPTDSAAGQIARSIGQSVGASLIPGAVEAKAAAAPLKTLAGVLGAGVASGLGASAAGAASQGTAAEPYARLAGGLAGGLLGPAALSKLVTPFPASADRTAIADALRSKGVPVTAGAATGNKGLLYTESELAPELATRQNEGFTGAALKTVGTNGTKADDVAMNNAFNRIGNEFDRLAAGNKLVPDQTMHDDIAETVRDYNSMVPANSRAPIIADTIDDLQQNPNGMTGAQYQSWRSRLTTAARNSSDPELSHALNGLANALDGAMERSIAKTNPDDVGAFKQVRNQYKNLLVIEKAATGAGENAANGLITPSALRSAVVNQSRRAYARGQGDLAQLARQGESILRQPPNSGTASRLNVRNMGAGFSSILGAMAGGHAGGLEAGAIGAGAGLLAPYVAGKVVASKPIQKYLANQLATKFPSMSASKRAALATLLAMQGSGGLLGSFGQ